MHMLLWRQPARDDLRNDFAEVLQLDPLGGQLATWYEADDDHNDLAVDVHPCKLQDAIVLDMVVVELSSCHKGSMQVVVR